MTTRFPSVRRSAPVAVGSPFAVQLPAFEDCWNAVMDNERRVSANPSGVRTASQRHKQKPHTSRQAVLKWRPHGDWWAFGPSLRDPRLGRGPFSGRFAPSVEPWGPNPRVR